MSLLTVHQGTPGIPREELRSLSPRPVPPSPGSPELPRLTTTVPREYVHRSSLAEVFLTSCERVGDDTFVLTGQWPRAHTFFTTADGRGHDPVQVGETIRQIGLYLCHAEYGVPLDHKVLLWSLDFESDPSRLRIGGRPTDLEAVATCADFGWQGRRFSGVLRVVLHRDGQAVGCGTARFSCVSPAVYGRLRGARAESGSRLFHACPERPAPIPAPAAGRLLPFDVVLAPSGRPGRWLLSPDLSHPILFEHANDHHPGMVLVEAARQAACALRPVGDFAPTAMAVSFRNYAEFGAPCWIDARPLSMAPGTGAGVVRAEVVGVQEEQEVFRAVVTGTSADA